MNAICLTFQFFFSIILGGVLHLIYLCFFSGYWVKLNFANIFPSWHQRIIHQHLSFVTPAYHLPTNFLRDTSVSFANIFPSWHQRIICQHISFVTPAYHLPTSFLRDTSVSFAKIFISLLFEKIFALQVNVCLSTQKSYFTVRKVSKVLTLIQLVCLLVTSFITYKKAGDNFHWRIYESWGIHSLSWFHYSNL